MIFITHDDVKQGFIKVARYYYLLIVVVQSSNYGVELWDKSADIVLRYYYCKVSIDVSGHKFLFRVIIFDRNKSPSQIEIYFRCWDSSSLKWLIPHAHW